MPKKTQGRKSYHHHDLRQALVDAAVVHLRDQDLTSLSMNRLAKIVGVSPGAPYHHFSDKTALLAAIGEDGFRTLLAAIRPASEIDDAIEALRYMANAHLRVAREWATHYRFMFLPEYAEDRDRYADLHALGEAALGILTQVILRGLPESSTVETGIERALLVFSTLHGFAALEAARVLRTVRNGPSLARQRALVVERIALIAFDPAK